MHVQLTAMPAFNVVGVQRRVMPGSSEIPAIWNTLSARMGEIQSLPHTGQRYGVMTNFDPVSGTFDYTAGTRAREDQFHPADMILLHIPEQTYAILACTLKTLPEVYARLDSQWLPQFGYRRTFGPEFEVYDDLFDIRDPAAILYLYIPVERVQVSTEAFAAEVF